MDKIFVKMRIFKIIGIVIFEGLDSFYSLETEKIAEYGIKNFTLEIFLNHQLCPTNIPFCGGKLYCYTNVSLRNWAVFFNKSRVACSSERRCL